jgi:hypothetical protein
LVCGKSDKPVTPCNPPDCNGHGTCKNGVCNCEQGWGGGAKRPDGKKISGCCNVWGSDKWKIGCNTICGSDNHCP